MKGLKVVEEVIEERVKGWERLLGMSKKGQSRKKHGLSSHEKA